MSEFDREYPDFSATLAGSEKANIIALGEMSRSVAISALNSMRREVVGETFVLRRTSGREHEVSISPAVYGEKREQRVEQVQHIAKQAIGTCRRE